MTRREDVVAAIIAGGRASRMGGGDKGRIEIGGAQMIARILRIVEPWTAAVILNANGDPDRWRDLGLPVAPDSLPSGRGPLAGVLSGMEWVRSHCPDARFLLTTPCDTPFLPGDFCFRLLAALADGNADIACAATPRRIQPVCAVWPVRMADTLRAAMVADSRLGAARWMFRHSVAEVMFPESAFTNVNTPEDRRAAEQLERSG